MPKSKAPQKPIRASPWDRAGTQSGKKVGKQPQSSAGPCSSVPHGLPTVPPNYTTRTIDISSGPDKGSSFDAGSRVRDGSGLHDGSGPEAGTGLDFGSGLDVGSGLVTGSLPALSRYTVDPATDDYGRLDAEAYTLQTTGTSVVPSTSFNKAMNHTGDIAATRKASRALRSAAEQAANGREEDASDVQAEEVEATQTRPKPEPEIPPYAHMQDRPAGFWAKRFLARIPKPWRGTVQQVADGMPQLVSMASRRRVASSRQNWEIEDPGLDVLLWEAMEEITLINQELDLGMSFSHFVAVADLLRGNPMVVMHYLTMHCDEGQTHFGSINDEHNNTIRRASKAASAICSCSTSYFIGWSRRPIVRRPCSGYLVALCLLCVAF